MMGDLLRRSGEIRDRGNDPGGTRTHDPRIKSAVLYQLSYGVRSASTPL
jgi:hypothetical protein